jgi:hypothetical protein
VLEHPDFNYVEAAQFGDTLPGAAAAVTCELYSANRQGSARRCRQVVRWDTEK